CGAARKRHRQFFPPAQETNNPCLRIPEDAVYGCTGTKAREAVQVGQPSSGTHLQIMPRFLTMKHSANPCPEPLSRAQATSFTHSKCRRPKTSYPHAHSPRATIQGKTKTTKSPRTIFAVIRA